MIDALNVLMRIVFFILMCLMWLFVAVQYNDPDGSIWMGIYSIPALWCALAVFYPQLFERTLCRMALLLSIVAALAGVVRFWPLTPRFWAREVWYNVETAREGMGLMIVAGVLAGVFFYAKRQSTGNLPDSL